MAYRIKRRRRRHDDVMPDGLTFILASIVVCGWLVADKPAA